MRGVIACLRAKEVHGGIRAQAAQGWAAPPLPAAGCNLHIQPTAFLLPPAPPYPGAFVAYRMPIKADPQGRGTPARYALSSRSVQQQFTSRNSAIQPQKQECSAAPLAVNQAATL